MSEQKLRFTRASGLDDIESLVLEAYIDEVEIADILRVDGKWYVIIQNAKGELVRITWHNWLTINYEFAKFMNEENEIILKEQKYDDEIDVDSEET